MTCAEFKELAGALALDALDADERAAARAHLSEPRHEGCPEAFARATAAARLLSGALPDVQPPDRVWRGIAARISARASRRRWAVASGWIAAAAAAVLAAILAGRNAGLHSEIDAMRARSATVETRAASSEELARQCAAQLEGARRTSGLARDAIALLEQRGSRVVAFAPQGGFGAAALAVVGSDGRRAILLSSALAPTAARDYQLWIIPPGKGAAPVPAGLVIAAGGIALGDFQPGVLARGAAALAVSAEPKGGSPTGAPTQVVLVAALGV
ncbi:MAG: anti-sigma factor domain-containing protein [Myxococcales bacterium]|nr:anti-sigma factor [Myxococcales bacterium]